MKSRLLSLLVLTAAFLPVSLPAAAADGKKSIVMIAGKPSHGPGEHEHNAGIQLLAKCLRESLGNALDVKTHLNAEWPSAEELASADTILIYSRRRRWPSRLSRPSISPVWRTR